MPVAPIEPVSDIFADDDGWQEMPIVREDKSASGLDEEDQKKYHYVASAKAATAANATGQLIDVDYEGNEWRSKNEQNENEYTRLRMKEEDEADEVHLRTKYLFDEDKAMTPLSQMQATKNLLTEAQRIAYVGLCALAAREMAHALRVPHRKELKGALADMELWGLKIMGRLYYHMEVETPEQKMIESLAEHGVRAEDLVPSLMTTHTIANPEYDPEEARREAQKELDDLPEEDVGTPVPPPSEPTSPHTATQTAFQTTARVLDPTSTTAIPGVSTKLSTTEKDVTLDIRWTILCDLFLILIADSVYDARSRVLLEHVALKLGLGWIDVVKFEARVTEALEIQEDVNSMENDEVVEGRRKAAKKKRYVMMGLATLGGGLVIGLSAGLLAPVIGAGIGAALTTVGIGGTTGFLAGTGGAAIITTGGALTGGGIAVKGMARRTQQVRTFNILPLHNNKRVSAILTVPGFLNGVNDDPRLPFSVLDPVVGDVFSVLWEPEMIQETGSALKILTGEVLTQIGQTVLQATVMTALMSALQWPIILTKLGYLIDNPWNNALDRAKAAGGILADLLMKRHLGVRPITLIGFSLGARVIFYALVELARQKAYGIVQDVFILGGTLSASQQTWIATRSVVSGRYVNAYARNDWVLNYLFRATSGGVGTVAGLRPVQDVPGLENVDVTDKIAGHMSYRTFMPLILDQLGFPVFADYFDEPEEPDFEEERIVVREDEPKRKRGWFTKKETEQKRVSRPPGATSHHVKKPPKSAGAAVPEDDDELPPREGAMSPSTPQSSTPQSSTPQPSTPLPERESMDSQADSGTSTPAKLPPKTAGFDFAAMKEMIGQVEDDSPSTPPAAPMIPPAANRTVSMPSARAPPLSPTSQSGLRQVRTPEPDAELSAGMRSMSVNDMNDRESDDDVSDRGVGPSRSAFTSPSMTSLAGWGSTFDAGRGVAASPYATFGASQQSLASNPFAVSQQSLASPFADPPRPSFGAGAPGLTFGSADGGLTFGAADGTIMTSPEYAPPPPPLADPWRVPADLGSGKKRTDTFSSNPWS
ncbi:hypothetical protein BD626DRAFT_564212 [Schizophyllum amplum]|uniref:DUF726-domain-containing protein n=1 Tax=Schizophyllum amplum TaxID=97359 RepID=A0A550D0P2_9AGAR|nr:hypothetical protein BD626DRAFT_564212 [Auriculariopsis ampla]